MAKSEYQKKLEEANARINSLGNFNFSDNAGLREVYINAYDEYLNRVNNPENYGYNSYINDVNALFEKLMNQERFSYDPKTDKLFQLYKQQYQNQGNRAMQNQMGVASALSGGYNSSAAQSAAKKAYQNQMNELAERASEAYQNSLDMYRYNQQNNLDKFNTALNMNSSGNDAYFRQTDAIGDKMNSAYNAFNDERNFQFNQYNNDRNFYQNQGQNAQNQINWLKEYELQKKLYKGK
jgi:hypothetical protein